MKEEPLPCGGAVIQDPECEYNLICQSCFCVVGSVGMPQRCRELLDLERVDKTNKVIHNLF